MPDCIRKRADIFAMHDPITVLSPLLRGTLVSSEHGNQHLPPVVAAVCTILFPRPSFICNRKCLRSGSAVEATKPQQPYINCRYCCTYMRRNRRNSAAQHPQDVRKWPPDLYNRRIVFCHFSAAYITRLSAVVDATNPNVLKNIILSLVYLLISLLVRFLAISILSTAVNIGLLGGGKKQNEEWDNLCIPLPTSHYHLFIHFRSRSTHRHQISSC